MFLSKLLIKPSEIIELLSYSDAVDLDDVTKTVHNIYKNIFIAVVFEIVIGVGMLFLVINTYKYIDSTSGIVFVVIIMFILLILAVIKSSLKNKKIYHAGSKIVIDDFNLLKSSLYKYFDSKHSTAFNELYSNIVSYYFSISELMYSIMGLVFIFIMMFLADISLPLKSVVIILGIVIIASLGVSGKYFTLANINIRDSFLSHRKPSRKDLLLRTQLPAIPNALDDILLPSIIVVLLAFNKNNIVAQLAFLSAIVGVCWQLMSKLSSFYFAKKNLVYITNYLNRISKKNVINNKGYEKQVAYCLTSIDVISQSKENRSLVLKNFTPKSITNKKKTNRNYSLEIKPGLYQLKGVNGIGKSTLLESITLTDDELVEFSKGEIAFNGKPLYDKNIDLYKHREKYKYIGRYTPELKLTDEIIQEYKSHKSVYNFLKNLSAVQKDRYSEGEKAIVAICVNLFEIEESAILVIDELISRVYEDEENNLRTELLEIIEKFAFKNGHIVIIVDHVLDIKHAIDLKMKSDGIEYVSVFEKPLTS